MYWVLYVITFVIGLGTPSSAAVHTERFFTREACERAGDTQVWAMLRTNEALEKNPIQLTARFSMRYRCIQDAPPAVTKLDAN